MEKVNKTRIKWFSKYFGISKPQYKLPFVDYSLNSDVPLYIDPFAITKDESQLGILCHNSIISYFQTLLDAIKQNDFPRIKKLISGRLSEPNEIYLGVGTRPRRGKGIGTEQEAEIIEALQTSNAAKTGIIQTIQELELHIEGIGPDKISDLVANIILARLAAYTEIKSKEFGIPTRPCSVGGFWNPKRKLWDGGEFKLPVINETDSLILVPREYARRDGDLMNHREFYKKYALTILQRELIDANDSLVETLRTGKRKGERRVTKKAIENDPRFKLSKKYISAFIATHPDSIRSYMQDLEEKHEPIDVASYSGKGTEDDTKVRLLLEKLVGLETGERDASSYHDTVFELIQYIFDFALKSFEKEYKMDGKRSRIDVLAINYADGGFFKDIKVSLNAGSVPIECKNYSSDLGNTEFNQLVDRMGRKTSRFGMLFCRQVSNRPAILKHQTDRWLRNDNLILVIDDDNLTKLVELRLSRDFVGIERIMAEMKTQIEYGNRG